MEAEAQFSEDDFEPELLEQWRRETAQPDWAARVAAALVLVCRERQSYEGPGPVARLDRAWADVDPQGQQAVRAVYSHPYWPQATGLRRAFEDRWPWPVGDADRPLAVWEAINIADEMDEPLGRYYDLLVQDDEGIHWWGDGYRSLSEHPDLRDQ